MAITAGRTAEWLGNESRLGKHALGFAVGAAALAGIYKAHPFRSVGPAIQQDVLGSPRAVQQMGVAAFNIGLQEALMRPQDRRAIARVSGVSSPGQSSYNGVGFYNPQYNETIFGDGSVRQASLDAPNTYESPAPSGDIVFGLYNNRMKDTF